MPTIDKTLKELEHWFLSIQRSKALQLELRPENFIDEQSYDEQKHKLDEEIRDANKRLVALLERYSREPEQHFHRHVVKLAEFYREGTYDESVFIMTKYPKAGEPQSKELQAVIDAVAAGIKKRHYKPRIAAGPTFHRWLWDNVELYLLGCARGVAIVEDKYAPELNPNVAMEWGWMTGMRRSVLFLREKEFQHERADWAGLLSEPFDWTNPAPGVEQALDRFLPLRPVLLPKP